MTPITEPLLEGGTDLVAKAFRAAPLSASISRLSRPPFVNTAEDTRIRQDVQNEQNLLKLARLRPYSALPSTPLFSISEIPSSSIETRSAPALARCYPRSFAFYLGNPISSILKILSFCPRYPRDPGNPWFSSDLNGDRIPPRAQLRWRCLPRARWRCSYPVEGLR